MSRSVLAELNGAICEAVGTLGKEGALAIVPHVVSLILALARGPLLCNTIGRILIKHVFAAACLGQIKERQSLWCANLLVLLPIV